MMNRYLTKTIAMVSAVVITAGSLAYHYDSYRDLPASAKTLAEIEQEKKEKQAQIDAKKAELAVLANDISQKAAYEQTLNEEIELISSKMLLIDTQLQSVLRDIDEKQLAIDALQIQIDEQQLAVDEGLETFKTRIRTLYVHGNDSVLSALVGASSFYDVLAKVDLIKRISKHDDEMITALRDDIKQLDMSQQDLTASMLALNLKQTEMQVLLDEFDVSRNDLNQAVQNTDAEKQLLITQQNAKQGELAANESEMNALREEEEEIILEAAREAARRAEEARQREEQERRAREEAARRTATTTTTTTTRATTRATTAATTRATTRTTTTTAAPVVTTARPAATTVRNNPVTTTAPATKAPIVTTVTTAAPATAAPTTAPTTAATTAATTTAAPVTTAPPANAEYRGGQLAWPAPGYYHISSPFGPRWGRIHKGIDISGGGIENKNACAAASGTVIIAKYGENGGYGNYVQIDHGNGLCTLYAHLNSISVSSGQHVEVGQKIGNIGNTGNSTGPHLHFSVIVNGTFVDPMPYLY